MAFLKIESKQKIAQLNTLLEVRLPLSGMVLNILRLISAGQFPKETVNVEFLAFENILDNPETAFIVVKLQRKQSRKSFVMTSTPHSFSKEHSAAFENIIDWKLISLFFVSDTLATSIEDMCQKHGSDRVGIYPCYYVTISTEDALNLTVDPKILESVEIKDLSIDDAEHVNNRWKGKDEDTIQLLQEGIKHIGSMGIYLKSTAKLVSGIVFLWLGSVNALFTEPEHQRKGYAEVLMRSVSKMIAERGLIPVANVELYNAPSLALMEKCGLHSCGTITWVMYTPNTGES